MKQLGDILFESGLLPREQIDRALATAAANRQRLREVLVNTGVLSELDIARALSTQLGLGMVDLRTTTIPREILALIPRDVAKGYQVIPIRLEGDRLIVATADPTNIQTEDSLRATSGYDIGFVVAVASDIKWALEEANTPRLGTILVQLGKISPEQLERALEWAHATGRRLGDVLVDQGVLSEADVAEAVRAQSRKLGTILVNAGLLTSDQLERALIIADASRQRLGEALIDMGLLPEMAIAHALAEQLGLRMAKLKSTAIPAHVIRLLPRHVAVELGVLPVREEGNRLIVATADPTNVEIEDYLRNLINRDITFAVAPPSDIAWALEKYYPARLAAVMDELARAGLAPTAVPQRERSDQQPTRPLRDNGLSLGDVVETTGDIVAPPPQPGRRGYRPLGLRLEVWLLAGALVALAVIPCAASSLIRGRLHPLNRKTALIQAAVDAYRTDTRVRTSSEPDGPWHEFPTDQTTYQLGADLVISMPLLLRAGYIRSVPASAHPVNGGNEGHYIWVIESDTGRVKGCHTATLVGAAVLHCVEGYNGRYP